MATRGQPVINVYPVANYSFGTKGPKAEKDHSVNDRLERLRRNYEREGMRRTVEALLLVQEHNHPHVLLFQMGQHFFRLPGGRLRPGEDEVEGLRRKLTNTLAPTSTNLQVSWDVGEVLGVFWRPNFDTVFYPYTPPHITRPKECRKLFVVQLPERCVFAVPKNFKLVAVPVFELLDNPRYGPVISAVPAVLSRLRLNVLAMLPPAPPLGGGQGHGGGALPGPPPQHHHHQHGPGGPGGMQLVPHGGPGGQNGYGQQHHMGA